MRLDVLNVVIYLNVKSRLVDFYRVVLSIRDALHLVQHKRTKISCSCLLLRHMRVGTQSLSNSLGLSTDCLRLLADVVLNEIVDQLVQVNLAIVDLWQVTVLIGHSF